MLFRSFHGHDHVYAKQDLDGLVYQEVPQPSASNTNLGTRGRDYNYVNGTVLGATGFLRVSVSPTDVKVDYVRTWIPSKENAQQRNGDLGDSYRLAAKTRPTVPMTAGAGGAARAETLAAASAVHVGYGVVETSAGAAPYGTAVFSLTQGGAVVSEAAVAGKTVYRVRVGPVADAAQAAQLAERLRAIGIPDARPALD